jgi:hypothetical protein
LIQGHWLAKLDLQATGHGPDFLMDQNSAHNLVEKGGYDAPMQMTRVTLVLRVGPEARNTASLLISVELELEAYGIVDAADEAHARVGLFLHGRFSRSLLRM